MAGANRFIDVTATAILRWLTQPERCPERDLIEWLLTADPGQPLALDAMASDLGKPASEVGRLLFSLNRENALQIDTQPPSPLPESGFSAGLSADLATLSGNAIPLVLSGSDGLVLARHACSAELAERAAARLAGEQFTPLTTLHFRLDQVCVLAASPLTPPAAAWVSLARRLLPVCGALSAGISTPIRNRT